MRSQTGGRRIRKRGVQTLYQKMRVMDRLRDSSRACLSRVCSWTCWPWRCCWYAVCWARDIAADETLSVLCKSESRSDKIPVWNGETVEPCSSSSRDLFPGLSKPVYRTSAPVSDHWAPGSRVSPPTPLHRARRRLPHLHLSSCGCSKTRFTATVCLYPLL